MHESNNPAKPLKSSVPRSQTNGHTNGFSVQRSFPPTWHDHSREEVTRILIQSLHELGYHKSASNLSQESGFHLEEEVVTSFRNTILDGNWSRAEQILFGHSETNGFSHVNGGGLSRASHLPLVENANPAEMLFWIRQQKYLELLESRDLETALQVLRQELTPLNQDAEKLHTLGVFLMCQSPDELKREANWDGARGHSRRELLSSLAKSISPLVMIPENRLATLLTQNKEKWVEECRFHNSVESPSLLHDHACGSENLPIHKFAELSNHKGEVWFIEFSHDGRFLATAGADRVVNIFEFENGKFELINCLKDHEAGVTYLAWSPDGRKLITITKEPENKLRIYDDVTIRETAVSEYDFDIFSEPPSAACWLSDNEFVVSSIDRHHCIIHYEIPPESEAILIWQEKDQKRLFGLALSPDKSKLAAHGKEAEDMSYVIVYHFSTKEIVARWHMHTQISSLQISSDSKFLLCGINDNRIHEFDIETQDVVANYEGHQQNMFTIRSCYGGATQTYIASGSEDTKIYIWRRGQKEEDDPLAILQEHVKDTEKDKATCVNAITWNSKIPDMFASAGDDASIIVWVSSAFLEKFKGL